MRTQRICLGELVFDGEPPIWLHADLPILRISENSAALQQSLRELLGHHFRPADRHSSKDVKLTVADVADWLGCTSFKVQQMVKLSRLHPVSDEDGERYFEAAEVRRIKCIPISRPSKRSVLQR